jgi:hypothetical protein
MMLLWRRSREERSGIAHCTLVVYSTHSQLTIDVSRFAFTKELLSLLFINFSLDEGYCIQQNF